VSILVVETNEEPSVSTNIDLVLFFLVVGVVVAIVSSAAVLFCGVIDESECCVTR
jgi:hypothetical protein